MNVDNAFYRTETARVSILPPLTRRQPPAAIGDSLYTSPGEVLRIGEVSDSWNQERAHWQHQRRSRIRRGFSTHFVFVKMFATVVPTLGLNVGYGLCLVSIWGEGLAFEWKVFGVRQDEYAYILRQKWDKLVWHTADSGSAIYFWWKRKNRGNFEWWFLSRLFRFTFDVNLKREKDKPSKSNTAFVVIRSPKRLKTRTFSKYPELLWFFCFHSVWKYLLTYVRNSEFRLFISKLLRLFLFMDFPIKFYVEYFIRII